MRIYSDFKDYYDIGMGLGYDPKIVYVRKAQEIERFEHRDHNDFQFFLIGFCGHIYPGLKMDDISYSHSHHEYKTTTGIAYNMEQVDKFVIENLDEDRVHYYLDEKSKRFYDVSLKRKNIEVRFANLGHIQLVNDKYQKRLFDLFQRHNTPIFVRAGGITEINAELKSWEFFRVKDAYTAYQEIEMYLGGVLRSQANPIPEIPDSIMVEAKGFDPKWIFRK